MEQKKKALNYCVGQAIQKRRNDLGISQKKLAEYAETTEEKILHYELGSRSIPVYTLFLISRALQVSVTELLSDIIDYSAADITLN